MTQTNESIPKKRGGLKNPISMYIRFDYEVKHRLIQAVLKYKISASEIIRQALIEKLDRL